MDSGCQCPKPASDPGPGSGHLGLHVQHSPSLGPLRCIVGSRASPTPLVQVRIRVQQLTRLNLKLVVQPTRSLAQSKLESLSWYQCTGPQPACR